MHPRKSIRTRRRKSGLCRTKAGGALKFWRRNSRAIGRVIGEHRQQTIAVVSHGTVIALFLARHSDRAAFGLWREMGLPSYAVLSLPELSLIEIAPRVA